jgi:hypothetical protein
MACAAFFFWMAGWNKGGAPCAQKMNKIKICGTERGLPVQFAKKPLL